MPDPGVNVEPNDEAELARGWTLGRYVVLDRLGRGAMGSVYAAYDPELARRVAVKVLRPGAALRQGLEAARQRLLREAQALAQLAHPNVVRVFDVGTDRGRVFLAMELVEGQSLRRWLGVPRGWREVVDVLEQAGRGLAAAHALGLVHRDFKPDNVLVAVDGRARVGDFGLVRRIGDDARLEPATSELEADAGSGSLLTAVGDVLGTPAYMAPEQHAGQEAGPRSDQYAFCVTAFEALYGRRPFDADAREGLVAAKQRGLGRDAWVELGPRGAAGRVPASVRAVLRRGLSPASDDRFAAMEPLLDALARSRTRAGMGRFATVAGAVVLGTVGMAMMRPGGGEPPCAGAGAVPSAAWDEASRDAVRERLGAHRSGEAAALVIAGLDRQVIAWAEADLDACEDTWIRGEQSAGRFEARRECLREQWIELEETVAHLRGADADTAAHGEALVEGLASPGECEHAQAPAVGRAEGLRRTFARVAVLRRAGRVDEAWAELEAAPQGEVNGGGPARALARGELLAERGEPEASEEELRRALYLARAAGDDRAEADAWLALGEAALAREGDLERARFHAEMAAAAVKAKGGDPTREARAEALLAEIAAR